MKDNDNINNLNTKNQMSDEEFFESIAQLYSEQEGLELLHEADLLNAAAAPTNRLDSKVKKLTGKRRSFSRKGFITAAACMALVFAVYNLQGPNSQSSAPSIPAASIAPSAPSAATPAAPSAPMAEAPSAPSPSSAPMANYEIVNLDKPVITELSFVSTKLPPGYSVSSMEFDYGETIFYVENTRNNHIVLTIAKSDESLSNDNDQTPNINDTPATLVLSADYSLLEFESDGLKYRLSTPFDYNDLIEISKNFI